MRYLSFSLAFIAYLSSQETVPLTSDNAVQISEYETKIGNTLDHQEVFEHAKEGTLCTGNARTPLIREQCQKSQRVVDLARSQHYTPSQIRNLIPQGAGPTTVASPSADDAKNMLKHLIVNDAKIFFEDTAVDTFLPDILRMRFGGSYPRNFGPHGCYRRHLIGRGFPFNSGCIERIIRSPCGRFCPRIHCGDRYFMPVSYRQVILVSETAKTLLHSRRFPAWILNASNNIPNKREYEDFLRRLYLVASWSQAHLPATLSLHNIQALKTIARDENRSLDDLLELERNLEKQIISSAVTELGGANVPFSTSSGTRSQSFESLLNLYSNYGTATSQDRRFRNSALSNLPLLTSNSGATAISQFPLSGPLVQKLLTYVNHEVNNQNIVPMVEFDWCRMGEWFFFGGLGALDIGDKLRLIEFISQARDLINNQGMRFIDMAQEIGNIFQRGGNMDTLIDFLSGRGWGRTSWLHSSSSTGSSFGLDVNHLRGVARSIQDIFNRPRRIGIRWLFFEFRRTDRRFCNEYTFEPPLPTVYWHGKRPGTGFTRNWQDPRDPERNISLFFSDHKVFQRLGGITFAEYPDPAELNPNFPSPLRVFKPASKNQPIGNFFAINFPNFAEFAAQSLNNQKLREFTKKYLDARRPHSLDECGYADIGLATGSNGDFNSLVANVNTPTDLYKMLDIRLRKNLPTPSTPESRCLLGLNAVSKNPSYFSIDSHRQALARSLFSVVYFNDYLLSDSQRKLRSDLSHAELGFLPEDGILNIHPSKPIFGKPYKCQNMGTFFKQAKDLSREGVGNPLVDDVSGQSQLFYLWGKRECCLHGNPQTKRFKEYG